MLYLAEEKGVHPIIIPEMGRNISLLDDFKAFWKIFRLIQTEKPHIIHTHTAKAGALGRAAAFLYNLLFILKLQTKKLQSLKKSGYHESLNNGHPAKVVHTYHGHVFYGYFSPLKTKLFLWVEKILGLLTDKIITVSKKQREEIISLGIGSPQKVIAIPLGLELGKLLDVDRFKGQLREELGISPETKLVGIIARIVPVKNHGMFIDAAAEFKKNNKSLKTVFVVVGDGELRGQIEGYAVGKGFRDDVIFLGFRRDLERIYADLDLVALTSLNEGSPVALIEAMAAAKPVISTDVGGVKDLFSSEMKPSAAESNLRVFDQGILVPSLDFKGFASGMEILMKDDKVRMKMGRNGRQMVWPNFDVSRLIKDMRELYEDLVAA
jgi:glycosyltransferase involved in cell wall biosynthesis